MYAPYGRHCGTGGVAVPRGASVGEVGGMNAPPRMGAGGGTGGKSSDALIVSESSGRPAPHQRASRKGGAGVGGERYAFGYV